MKSAQRKISSLAGFVAFGTVATVFLYSQGVLDDLVPFQAALVILSYVAVGAALHRWAATGGKIGIRALDARFGQADRTEDDSSD